MATATAVDRNPGVDSARPWFLGLPWIALFWIAVLGPFFFLSYGFANDMASRRADVPSIVFGWEKAVPFLPWTIVPYWTTDLLYCVSLLICTTRRELNMHVKRLLAAQVISVGCFLAFPLLLTYQRPETHGFFGWLFQVLSGFDKPFNQAPSLHVSLTVILWTRFRAHLDGIWRMAMGGWLLLIVVSTMTTYQHQFLDLPTGALAGLLTVALFPDRTNLVKDLVGQAGSLRAGCFTGAAASPVLRWRTKLFQGLSNAEAPRRAQRQRMSVFYLSGAALATAIAVKLAAIKLAGVATLLLWPATSMLLVAVAYAADCPGMFHYPVIRLLLLPYTAAAWINSRCWTRGQPAAQEIADGVWLGRVPARTAGFRSIVNLAAELPLRAHHVPMLDLVRPTEQQLEEAVSAIEMCRSERPTLVCCALGYSRSAAAVAAWLVATRRASSMHEAVGRILRRRPGIVLPHLVLHNHGECRAYGECRACHGACRGECHGACHGAPNARRV